MSNQEEIVDFYAAGRKLAEHIVDYKGNDIPTATLQALIKDLLPQHEELQEALRSIVARPDFLQLAKLAGSGKGILQRDRFLERLKNVYSSKIISDTKHLTSGLLQTGTVNSTHPDTNTQNDASNPEEINLKKRGCPSNNLARGNGASQHKGQKGKAKSYVAIVAIGSITTAAAAVVALTANRTTTNKAPFSAEEQANKKCASISDAAERYSCYINFKRSQNPAQASNETQLSHKETGKKFLANGSYIAAIKELRIAVESNPNDSDAWGNLGLAYAYLENRQEAINAYTAGLQSLTSRGLSESPSLLEMRGHSLLEIGEFTSAISDYTKAIQANLKRDAHDTANSLVFRAEAYTKAGDEKAASRDTAAADCLYKLAKATNHNNDYQRNLDCIE
jgi:tetratricopeptide (TPR) repeat protein